MTEARNTAAVNGEVPNPYNKNKPWHNDSPQESQTADSLFHPPKPQEPSQEDTSNAQNHDWEKRFKDFQGHYDETAKELKQTRAALAELQQKFAASTSGSTEETNEQSVQTTSVEETNTEDNTVADDARIKALQEQVDSLTAKDKASRKAEAMSKIRAAHSDIDEITGSDDFHTWAATKSQRTQDAIYKNPYDYKAAIEALDLYKAESAKAAQAQESERRDNQSEVDASSLVSTRNVEGQDTSSQPKVWKASEIRSMNPRELESRIDEINKAAQEGRILQD